LVKPIIELGEDPNHTMWRVDTIIMLTNKMISTKLSYLAKQEIANQ